MRQNSILKKMNSYLCVIDTLKFRTHFLIMRHTITRALALALGICTHEVSTYVRKYKVSYPEGATAAEMATATADDVYVHRIQCCMRGYHVYQWIWYPTIGEILGTTREWDNTHDRYAVAVLEADTCCVVGHLPHVISRECYFF